MSARRSYRVYCDHAGCGMSFSAAIDRADATRARAGEDGWVHGVVTPQPHTGGPAKSIDYCPEHASDIGDLKPKTLPRHARPT